MGSEMCIRDRLETWEPAVRESVRQTLSDYTAATDSFNLSALASCFTSNGVLEYTGGDVQLVGPSQIESGLSAQLRGADPDRIQPSYVRHHVSSVRFSRVLADRVEASSYFVVLTDHGVDHWGRYRDVLVPQAGRWLFTSRCIKVDGFSPTSLMNPAENRE